MTTSSRPTFWRGKVDDLAVDGHRALADELVAGAARADAGAREVDHQVHGLGRAHWRPPLGVGKQPRADLLDLVGAQRELLERRQLAAAREPEQLQEALAVP